MARHRVCPWWVGYFDLGPIRRLAHDPAAILAPFVRAGMTVLEPGPGMGFFTLELARLVGPMGRVVAVDVQPKMIEALRRRARIAGLIDRIDARAAPATTMTIEDLEGTIDFVLAFAVVHEIPSADTFFAETARAMKPSARLLLAEPAGHVGGGEFDQELALAAKHGLSLADRPSIRRCLGAVLQKL
jgi:ubiquinone/menaquinone biosynthesis C-methylase UbiE